MKDEDIEKMCYFMNEIMKKFLHSHKIGNEEELCKVFSRQIMEYTGIIGVFAEKDGNPEEVKEELILLIRDVFKTLRETRESDKLHE